MPDTFHDTRSGAALQAPALLADAWEQEVVSRLPADLDQQAYALGAFQRRRGLLHPRDLLRGLLAYALSVLSWRQLGTWAVLIALADISEAAWRKRLRKAHPWLVWLLGELLSTPKAVAGFAQARARILLLDTTRLSHPGGYGDDWRVHMAYNLLNGRLCQMTLGDRHSGEYLEHYAFQPGDIGVADGAYGYRRSVAYAKQQGADVVLRITWQSFPLETSEQQPLDIPAWLRSGRRGQREWIGFCRWQGQCYRVRLIAVRLPPDKAELARKRLLRLGTKHGHPVRAEALALAEWVLLVTTLNEQTWPRPHVLRLYRARWQIELVFKRIKQLLRLNTVRVKEQTLVEAVICLHLLAWVLHEQEAAWVRRYLACLGRAVQVTPLSSWRLAALHLQTLRHVVLGTCPQQAIRQTLPRLLRFLCGSPRKRKQQETQLRCWLSRKIA